MIPCRIIGRNTFSNSGFKILYSFQTTGFQVGIPFKMEGSRQEFLSGIEDSRQGFFSKWRALGRKPCQKQRILGRNSGIPVRNRVFQVGNAFILEGFRQDCLSKQRIPDKSSRQRSIGFQVRIAYTEQKALGRNSFQK